MQEKDIEQVHKEYSDKWMLIPGVEGTAISISEGKSCIIVFSSINAEKLRASVPSKVEGYPVIIKQTGKFHALGNE